MYRERPSVLHGAVVWTTTAAPGEHRVLPDGCMDLIWAEGALLIAGPDTQAHLATRCGAYTGLRFAPGTAPVVLGLPAHELRNRRVPLAELWDGPDVRRVEDQMARAGDPGRALEQIARRRFPDGRPPITAMTRAAHTLGAGARVSTVADALGLSPRQLHRRSLDAFGYGPKILSRVLRMNRALALARAGAPFAETAYRTGYADQAHLAARSGNSRESRSRRSPGSCARPDYFGGSGANRSTP